MGRDFKDVQSELMKGHAFDAKKRATWNYFYIAVAVAVCVAILYFVLLYLGFDLGQHNEDQTRLNSITSTFLS